MAAVASVAAEVAAAAAEEVVVGATAAVTTTSDLTRFRLRNLNFLHYFFAIAKKLYSEI